MAILHPGTVASLTDMKLLPLTMLAFRKLSHADAASETPHLVGHENKIPSPPGYTHVRDDDKEMDLAVQNARQSRGFFFSGLHDQRKENRTLQTKKSFVNSTNFEHIFIGHLSFVEGALISPGAPQGTAKTITSS